MTTVEQPYATGSFTENAPQGHVRTVFHADNPLQHKVNETHLKEIAALSQKDRYAWIDAEIRKVLPDKFYRLVVNSWTEKDKKKAADMMAQADHYMRTNRIQIVHPGGRSLHTFIYVKGVIVAEYELRLDIK